MDGAAELRSDADADLLPGPSEPKRRPSTTAGQGPAASGASYDQSEARAGVASAEHDGALCRICRSGAEPDNPLFYPCKCSGSIRYCHQDCLVEWLRHSKKKYCELCQHPFVFRKRYARNMPEKLPSYLYARKVLSSAVGLVQTMLRTVIVIVTWLAILPLGNQLIFRLYIWSGDFVVWSILGGDPPPGVQDMAPPITSTATNASAPGNVSAAASPTPSTAAQAAPWNSTLAGQNGTRSGVPTGLVLVDLWRFARSLDRDFFKVALNGLARDCFEGQVLTCVIVVVFVSIFLLREWILQNMPQPLHALDEGAAPLPEPEAPPEAPVPPAEAGAAAANGEQRRQAQNANVAREASETGEEPVTFEEGGVRAEPAEPQEAESLPLGAESRHQEDDEPRLEELCQKRIERSMAHAGSSGAPGPSRGDGPTPSPSTQAYGAAEASGGRDDATRGKSSRASSILNDGKGKGKARSDDADPWSSGAEDSDRETPGMALVEGSAFARRPMEQQPRPQPVAFLGGGVILPESLEPPHIHSTGDAPFGEDVEEPDATEIAGTQRVPPNAAAPPVDPGDAEERVREDEAPDAAGQPAEAADDNDAGQVADPADAEEAAWMDVPDDELGEQEHPDAMVQEDDLDGMLEAIGLRGPMENLTSNVIMMLVLCSFILLVFVAIPYVLGRLLGLGGNAFRFMLLPVRLLRLVTDPVFDFAIDKIMRSLRLLLRLVGTGFSPSSTRLTASTGRWTTTPRVSPGRADRFAALLRDRVVLPISVFGPSKSLAVDAQSVRLRLGMLLRHALSGASERGNRIVHALEAKLQGRTTSERIFCIGLGWAHWTVAMALQSRFGDGFYRRLRITWAKSAIEQQLVIIKVLVFVVIELVVFPMGCGLLLDLCMMPLWSGVDLKLRFVHLQRAPFATLFMEWMVGTLWMYAFAQFISSVRSIARPGVMAWIRDSSDPNFSPVREILERKATIHLRKIGISAVMYATVLVAMAGVNVAFVRYCLRGVLPVVWRPHQTLSSTPFDLLVVLLVMRPVIRTAAPNRYYRRWSRRWWASMARRLRLTAFLIGGAHPEQEGRHVHATWRSWWRGNKADIYESPRPDSEVRFVRDGSWARVANDDNAVTSSPLIIPTDASGEPQTEQARRAIEKQVETIKRMPGRQPSYTISYLPPHFRIRLLTLVFALWATLSGCAVAGFVAPLLAGRAVLWLAGWYPAHDVYAYSLGVLSLLLFWNVGHSIFKRARKVSGLLSSRTGRRAFSRRAASKLLKLAKRIWVVAAFGFLSPVLVGMLVEVYLLAPLRFGPMETPRLLLAQVWACGLVEQYLAARVSQMFFVAGRLTRQRRMRQFFVSVIEICNVGLRRPRPKHWSKTVLLPLLGVASALLLGPLIVAWVVSKATGAQPEQASILLRLFHSVILGVVLGMLLYRRVESRIDVWTAVLRDEFFLESTQLANFEPKLPSRPSASRRLSRRRAHERRLAHPTHGDTVATVNEGADATIHGTSHAQDPSIGPSSSGAPEPEQDNNLRAAATGEDDTGQIEVQGPLPDILLR